MNKYFGIVLFKIENQLSNRVTYEETYLSIDASNAEEAKNILIEYSKSCETDYLNEHDELIRISFERIIDINKYLRDKPQGKYQEIYSRHFDDLEAYSRFEKLFKKSTEIK